MEQENIDLGRRVGHVSHLYRRNIDRVIAAEFRDNADSVTGRNFQVLRYLEDHPDEDVFQKDLEAEFKIRRSTVSCMVDLMEQKGLLLRESVNGDARLKRLKLTPKAKQTLNAVFQRVRQMEEEIRSEFSPGDYRTLTVLLERLSAVLENRETNIHERNLNNPI